MAVQQTQTQTTSTERAIEKRTPNTESTLASQPNTEATIAAQPTTPGGSNAPAYLAIDPTQPIHSFEAAMALGKVLYDSKIYSLESASQAVVKIIAGAVHGFNPIASMSTMQIIKGSIMMHYAGIAGKIKAHPKYDYKINRLDNEMCELEIFENGKSIGLSTFDQEDAKVAETGKLVAPGAQGSMLKRFTRNMLFARAMSNAARMYCSEVFLFQPVYTFGEIPEDTGDSSGMPALEERKHQDRAAQIIGHLQKQNPPPPLEDVTAEDFSDPVAEEFTEDIAEAELEPTPAPEADSPTIDAKEYGLSLERRLAFAEEFGITKGALATWQSMDEVPENEDEVRLALAAQGSHLTVRLMSARPKTWREFVGIGN